MAYYWFTDVNQFLTYYDLSSQTLFTWVLCNYLMYCAIPDIINHDTRTVMDEMMVF